MQAIMKKVIIISLIFTQSIVAYTQESNSEIGFEIQPISASHIHFYKPESQNHQLSLSASLIYTRTKPNHNWMLGFNFAVTAFEYSNLNYRYGFFIHQSRNLGSLLLHQFGVGINYSNVTVSTNNFVIVNNKIIDLGKIKYNHFNPNIEYRVGIGLGKNDNVRVQIPLRLEFLYPFRDSGNRLLKGDIFYGLNFYFNFTK